ncbi:extracellular exo-polygalacturonase [Venturia nashicola]|nr:extracellular exo-polygalacturonase [Venturia nashicola]
MLNFLHLLALCAGVSARSLGDAVEHPQSLVRRADSPAYHITVGPKPPFKPMPASTARDRECVVKGGTTEDSAAILAAIKSCNDGGKVVFSADTTYTVGKVMDLTKLSKIDLVIKGKIVFTPDIEYWTANAFKHTFQKAVSFFQIGGSDVNVYGGGSLDGNGGVWGTKSPRPILFAIIGLNGGQIDNLNLVNSPQWFNLIKNSSNVVYNNIKIKGKNKNTDGWDTLNSKNIVIQNSDISNGDDCVSFKPGSIDIVVQNLVCLNSHSIAVGSLGQYKGEVDIVENIIAYNITMINASHASRIKSWAGHGVMSGVGSGGGGSGRVNNVTFEKFKVSGVESAITITQCYGEKDAAKDCEGEKGGYWERAVLYAYVL